MRRFIASAIAAGFLSIGFVGCAEESKVETTEKVSTPEGSTSKTVTEKIESKGSNPPTDSAGETAKTPK